jgi:hypothetical protein
MSASEHLPFLVAGTPVAVDLGTPYEGFRPKVFWRGMVYLNVLNRKRPGTGEREWLMRSHGYQRLAERAGLSPTKDAIGVWFSDAERVELARISSQDKRACGPNPKSPAVAEPTLPSDLIPLRKAAPLVDRGYSTLRQWVRAGWLVKYRVNPESPENSPMLLSRAAVLALAASMEKAYPIGRRPAAPACEPDRNCLASLSSERSRLEERLKLLTAAEEAHERVQAAEQDLALLRARAAEFAAALDPAPRRSVQL